MRVRKKMSDGDETVRTSSGGRKVSIVLPADLAERVERRADARGDRLTTTVVRLIEAGEKQADEGIREDAFSSLRTELLAEVAKGSAQAKREVQAQAHRLSHLLVRSAIESVAARLTASHVLFKMYADEEEEAKRLYNSAWSDAVRRLREPTPSVRQTMNLIVEGAGAQEPTALVGLAAATRELRQGLEVVATLAARVDALESQVEAQGRQAQTTQKALGELNTTMQNLTKAVNGAVVRLATAEEEARTQPRGIFGGRR